MTPDLPPSHPLATLLGRLERWSGEGRSVEVQDLEARLTERAGDDPRFWRGLSELRLRLAQPGQAARSARRWSELEPRDPAAFTLLARALAVGGLWADAVTAANAAFARGRPSPVQQRDLAETLLAVSRPDRALDLLQPLLADAPADAALLQLTAACERQLGELDKAYVHVEAALRLAPDDGEALWIRSDLRRATRSRNHIDDLRARLSAERDGPAAAYSQFALGKELEQLGEYDEAFTAFAQGASLVLAQRRLDPRREIRRVERLTVEEPAPSRPASSGGDSSAAPIFIVGLPRSGSSLVERVLGAHPRTLTLGEPPAFARAMDELAGADGAQHPATIGRAYLRIVGDVRGLRPIDKRPLNMLHVTEIVAALPRARIVLVQRDLRDCGWAAFKTLFNADAYAWSYALEPLGEYLRTHGALAKRWRADFPQVVHSVRYENLVRDLEGQARQLLEFCDLPWEPACLRFHESAAPATSASAVQVRSPVHESSVGLWRRYAQHLAPMLAALGDAE